MLNLLYESSSESGAKVTIYDGTDVSGIVRPWDLLPSNAVDLRGTTVVVMTSHPHDTATFTGLTILRLVGAGARVVLVATAPQLNEHVRIAALLGVDRLVPLGSHDGEPATPERVDVAARLVAGICLSECADALIHYDKRGINGDPARVVGHQIGAAAARIARVTSYEATVDQHYLAAVDPRPARRSVLARRRGAFRSDSSAITTAVAADVITLTAKRESMRAQPSPTTIESLRSPRFGDLHGLEWYARRGSPNVLERLATTA